MDSEAPTELNWQTGLPAALVQARSQQKPVLLDFTGSDWCPPCRQLNNRVFASPEFKSYADSNLVLVQVDFPRSKPQSEELKKSNEALQKQYEVEGFPTIILLSPEGKILKRETGYGGATAVDFITALEQARKGG